MHHGDTITYYSNVITSVHTIIMCRQKAEGKWGGGGANRRRRRQTDSRIRPRPPGVQFLATPLVGPIHHVFLMC